MTFDFYPMKGRDHIIEMMIVYRNHGNIVCRTDESLELISKLPKRHEDSWKDLIKMNHQELYEEYLRYRKRDSKMIWIKFENGARPADDQTVLAKNEKFPKNLPEMVYWDEEDQEFMPLDHNRRLPVKVTHWMPIPEFKIVTINN